MSLQRRFLLRVLPALVVLNLLAAFGSGYVALRAGEDRIRARASHIAEGLAASLGQPLQASRLDVIARRLGVMAGEGEIVAARMLDTSGKLALMVGTPSQADDSIATPIFRGSGADAAPGGTLMLDISLRRAWADARARVVSALTLGLAVTLAMLVGVLGVSRAMIARPLSLLKACIAVSRRGERARVAWASDDEIGDVVAAFNAMQERLEAEEATLRAASARLERLYNGTPAMLHSIDRLGRLVGVSEHWLAKTGHARNVVLGQPLDRILTPESAARYRAEILPGFLASGSTADAPLSLRRPDGTVIEVVLNETAERGSDGAVIRSLSVMNDITALTQAQQGLEKLALIDPLTGLLNRVGLLRMAQPRLAEHARAGQAAVMIKLGIDRLRAVNGTHGEAAGDRMLVVLARRIARTAGSGALVARVGGDEFAVLAACPPHDERRETLAQALLVALRRPVRLQGFALEVTASLGTARAGDAFADVRADDASAEALLTAAEQSMEAAKRGGRDRAVEFGAAVVREMAERRRTEAMVREAIREGWIGVHAQPILSLADGRVAGAEILARLQHPKEGMVPPSVFIPAAEESGEMPALGRVILEQAFAALPPLLSAVGGEAFYLAVNLSPAQVLADLPDEVATLAARHQVDPARLLFEITETALFGDAQRAGTVLRALAARGFRFAVDDFGTGYSSLSYVTRFPVHMIKIERAFTASLTAATPDDAERTRVAVVRAVVALARELSLPLVAEGIETEAEHAAARRFGFTHGQGYLFARPMPIDALSGWLAAQEMPQEPAARRA